MDIQDWVQIHAHILELEQEGVVTRTFRRLDPERQQRVLIAILEEAVAKGPSSINIKQVAARAGVAIGSLYAYFGNRTGLLTFTIELCARFIRDSFDSFRPILASMPVREALAAYLMGGVAWGQTQTGLMQFFARAAYVGDDELGERFVRPIAQTLVEMVREIIEAAQARGEIRQDIDLDTIVRVVNVLMIGMGDSQLLPYLNAYYQLYADDAVDDQLVEASIDLILNGIGTDT